MICGRSVCSVAARASARKRSSAASRSRATPLDGLIRKIDRLHFVVRVRRGFLQFALHPAAVRPTPSGLPRCTSRDITCASRSGSIRRVSSPARSAACSNPRRPLRALEIKAGGASSPMLHDGFLPFHAERLKQHLVLVVGPTERRRDSLRLLRARALKFHRRLDLPRRLPAAVPAAHGQNFRDVVSAPHHAFHRIGDDGLPGSEAHPLVDALVLQNLKVQLPILRSAIRRK